MTKVYFVRHGQPIFSHENDYTRPLSDEGKKDIKIVLELLQDKNIDVIYCSPYKRSIDTIQPTANFYNLDIIIMEDLKEREKGIDGNLHHGMFKKRWEDHDYHESGGESINMVQKRNIKALKEILEKNEGKNIIIGTHGTSLSTILNYYNPSFGCDNFLRIIDWMPYVLLLEFEGQILKDIKELGYVEKEYK